MADISGRGDSASDGRGYVGCRYQITPLPAKEELDKHAERVRIEIGIHTAGRQVIELAGHDENDLGRLRETLDSVSTTKPGWWF